MKRSIKATAFAMIIITVLTVLPSCLLYELVPDFIIPEKDAKSLSEIRETVTVSLAEGDNFKILSDNPVRVQRGSSVSFEIEIADGYEYVSNTEGASFENGYLKISKAEYPITVELTVKEKDTVVELPDEPEPEPEPEPPTEPEIEYETIVLDAEKKNGFRFICWTADVPAEEGGAVFSEQASGTFKIPKGSEAVANYVDEGHFVILYRTNGGVTAADGKDYYYQTYSNEHYLMPNTLHQNGTFKRDGYTLLRYTEEQDGSGEYTTLGGKIYPNENGFNELWLQWAKNTVKGLQMKITTNESSQKTVTVVGYTEDAEQVVIPQYVNGYPVEKIEANVFKGKSMKSLVLPASIKTVENGAFDSCTQLEELTVHDNFISIRDEAFSNCRSIRTYYLNAGVLPAYAGNGEGMFCMKYERLRALTEAGVKKIMVMSGSSSLYGFKAKEMQDAFGGEYQVVNYGTNAGTSVHFYIDAFMRYIGEGDIVLQAPETSSGTQLGDTNITWRLFRGCGSMYEVFSFVDMTQYTDFFDELTEYNTNQRKLNASYTGKSYESWSKFLDEYSDMTTNKKDLNKEDYLDGSSTGNPFGVNSITAVRTARLNVLCSRIRERGAEMYMSWAPVNANYCNATAKQSSTQQAFKDKMQSLIDYKIISDIDDYILEGKYFNNSNYHPGDIGASIRTERLTADLKAQLISEGKWQAGA